MLLMLLSLLWLLSLICALIALLRPRTVWPFKSPPHRGKTVLLYLALTVALTAVIGMTNPQQPVTAPAAAPKDAPVDVPQAAAPSVETTPPQPAVEATPQKTATPPKPATPTKAERQAAAAREAIPVFEAAVTAVTRDSDLAMKRLQQQMELLGAGKASAGDVYGAAREAQEMARQLWLKVDRDVQIPDGVSDEVEQVLRRARDHVTDLGHARQSAARCLAAFLENKKPSDEHCFNQAAKDTLVQAYGYGMRLTEAKMAVGLLSFPSEENATATPAN